MTKGRFRWLLIGMLGLLTAACAEPEQGVPEMNEQERQTVEAYTDTLAPVCMGRFQAEMPEQLALRSSSLTVNSAEISARRMSRTMFQRFIRDRKETLEATDPIDDRDRPYLKGTNELGDNTVIIDRNESHHTPDALRVLEGYAFDGLTMFKVEMKARDITDDRYKKDRTYVKTNKSERLKQVEYLLRHLHPRKAGEMPEGPGLCFEHGFLAGGTDEQIPGAALSYREEEVAMTFVDRAHRDVYIHFNVDSTVHTGDTLLDRMGQAEAAMKAKGDNNFSALRRGKVELKDIEQVEEWLGTFTTDDDVRGNYFTLEANSERGSAREPLISMTFKNGEYSLIEEDPPKLDKASLTDAEAVGLWDAITRTFKPRPGAF